MRLGNFGVYRIVLVKFAGDTCQSLIIWYQSFGNYSADSVAAPVRSFNVRFLLRFIEAFAELNAPPFGESSSAAI